MSNEDLEQIPCSVCGSFLTQKQIRRARVNGRTPTFCSNQCAAGKSKTFESVGEPELSTKSIDAFYRTIQRRKDSMLVEDLEMIRQQTPTDDSPEAEKRLRESLCPNPPAYIYSTTGTANGR